MAKTSRKRRATSKAAAAVKKLTPELASSPSVPTADAAAASQNDVLQIDDIHDDIESIDDSDIEILTPSRFPQPPSTTITTTTSTFRNDNYAMYINNNNNNNNNDDHEGDNEIEITSSSVTNPNVDYPHMRHLCGVYTFHHSKENNGNDTNEESKNRNKLYCPKCYCYICDTLASECKLWEGEGNHCSAHDKNVKYVHLREAVALRQRGGGVASASQQSVAVPITTPRNPYQRSSSATATSKTSSNNSNLLNAQQQQQQQHDLSPITLSDAYDALRHQQGQGGQPQQQSLRGGLVKEQKDKRITEIFLENFRRATALHDGYNAASAAAAVSTTTPKQKMGKRSPTPPCSAFTSTPIPTNNSTTTSLPQKMEGDIPTLSLYNSFFVEGIKIGWPYPEIMKPQRQMAIHIIKALKNRRHVVLESPTGTGKSAAILCSVLAWQRYHYQMEKRHHQQKQLDDRLHLIQLQQLCGGGGVDDDEEAKEVEVVRKVKIIYCSRTHSQVAQMVASLKSTPYRPRMAILGSRDKLCIHKNVKPRGDQQGDYTSPRVNISNECRLRVRNTEKARKYRLSNSGSSSSEHDPYNDNDPPAFMPGDGDGLGEGAEEPLEDTPMGEVEGEEGQGYIGRSKTCPHYRQLTASRIANLAHSTFVPNEKVNCCSVGGKQSTYGAHDIEDLVSFGVDPYLQKDIALYRSEVTESFGLSLRGQGGRYGGSVVREVKKDTPADICGSIKADDKIMRVNGQDVSQSNPATVVELIKSSSSDPLLLDVSRRAGVLANLSSSRRDDEGYSSHAACPYYISQALAKDADIVFCPYNYVLDPGIREAMAMDLSNAVVILDEGHNVEDTLREAGSGIFGELELCELIVMLNNYSITERSTWNLMEVVGAAGIVDSDATYLCDVAHSLLMIVENVVKELREARNRFEENPGAKGAAGAIRDWEKFHTQDDTEFEISVYGPTGKYNYDKCIGCKPFFDNLGMSVVDLDCATNLVNAFEKFFRGRDGNDAPSERDRMQNLVDRLKELIHKLYAAMQSSEHYYAAISAIANGSLDFASGGDGEFESGGRVSKKKPRSLPLIPPRSKAHPDRPANPCLNPICRAKCVDAFHPVRHGDNCDGTTPKWEARLHLNLLTPGPLMQQLSNECRTIVLASGSLSPIPSLCAELNLFSEDDSTSPMKPSQSNANTVLPNIQKRLQNHPSPLEADHIVNLNKQFFAVSIGHFPDGSELKVSQKNYSSEHFIPKLGDALVRIVAGIPEGGVLVFLPNYALLRKCERQWNPNHFFRQRRPWGARQMDEIDDGPSIWDRLKDLKHNVVVEPSGSQDEFEEKKREYMETIRTKGGCVLLAVYRGKMSEGISFNDNNARGVVCIGLPLPSAFALPVKIKMNYNDEQRKLQNRTDLLPGQEWYTQQAYRAIAQALGRCIRHSADYGAIFLMDIRHCDDLAPNGGIPQAHINLPKWMRKTVKNLSKHSTGGTTMLRYVSSSNSVLGGWPGLKNELQQFFRNAKTHAQEVLKQQNAKVAGVRNNCVVHSFDIQTNKWSENDSSIHSPIILDNCPVQSNAVNSSSTPPEQNNNASSNDLILDSHQSKPSSKSARIKHVTLQDFFQKQQKQQQQQEEESEGSQKNSEEKESDSPTYTPLMNSISIEASPFENDVVGSTNEPDVDGRNPAVDNHHAKQAITEDENLCVVCDDAKKQIILLPCKHMCLCKTCSDRCLFDTIKECPLCRAEIKDSMEVFW